MGVHKLNGGSESIIPSNALSLTARIRAISSPQIKMPTEAYSPSETKYSEMLIPVILEPIISHTHIISSKAKLNARSQL
ncbi:MAG: hypothetical protein QXW00_01050 [Candidatus Woesearchaeota archaeon]